MADILIKNMEMPEEGFVRMMLWHDGGVAIEVSPKNYEQLEDKAVELPPHGDLIDKEELIRKLRTYNWVKCGTDVMTVIENALVVLEAST